MRDGIYRLFHLQLKNGSHPLRRMAGRFVLHNGEVLHLEDHLHTLNDHLPEGPFTTEHRKQLAHLLHSPYWILQNEDDLHAGEHPEDIEEVDLGPLIPDAIFNMLVPGAPQPLKVEVHGDTVTVEGRRLSDEEAQALMEQIQQGQVQLQHITPETL